MKKITVSKNDVAKIIGMWWTDYEEHPEKFTKGPDLEGKSSSDLFFGYAKKIGIKPAR